MDARKEGAMKMNRLIAVPIAAFLLLAFAAGCGEQEVVMPEEQGEVASTEADIPEKYTDIYDELEAKLGELDAYLDANSGVGAGDTVFSVELITANSNRGEALFYEGTFHAIQLTLDSLKDLGVGGITLSVQYPVLNADFPRSSEYLDFYRKVATEVKARGLTLIVETTSIFPNPEVSPLVVDYAGLTLDEYMREKRAMAETVLRELDPDYLTLENEPTTQQANTGLDFSVANQTEIVNYILSGLDRSHARIGAGAGTWDDLAYFESLATGTDLDYLDMHIYPIQGELVIDRAETISAMARAGGKGLTVGEAWLYKLTSAELARSQTIATAVETFERDGYSFWAPLDQAYLEVMVELSHYLDLEFLSPFWMQYLYTYLEYDTSTMDMGYAELQGATGQKAWQNIQEGLLSPTGEAYRDLIKPD
jgi:hypothetical protein